MKKNLLTLFASQLMAYGVLIAQPTVYTIPGSSNLAYGISPSGNYVTGSGSTGGFLYKVAGGIYQNIGGEEAWSVNDYGKVVGNYLDSNYQYNNVSFPIAGFYDNGTWSTPGLLPGIAPVSTTQYSYGYGISDDGLTMCGMVWKNAGITRSFTWNSTNGFTLLRDRNQSSKAMCLSGNGLVAGGWVQGNMRLPYYWKADSVLLDPNGGETHAINYDGSKIVGTANGMAFLWDSIGGIQYLPLYPGANGADATGISDSGIVVGYYETGTFPPSTRTAFIYIPGQGMLNLRDYLISLNATNVPSTLSVAQGISRDGKHIIAFNTFPFVSYVIEFDSTINSIALPAQSKDWFYVSPNPVYDGKINIKASVSDTKSLIQIRDLTGREIMNLPVSDLTKGEFQTTMDLKDMNGHNLIPGIYLINLVTVKGTTTRKVVVH
jgi:probable HAF family extracellular repeat protein